MPSGFLILSDGRCFAARWRYYDQTLLTVAESLEDSRAARALRDWLMTLVPGPGDIEELGYGAWLRSKDQQIRRKYLDIRELTPENQRLFLDAALHAGERAKSAEATTWDSLLVESLAHLSDKVDRLDRGEPPLSRSDWVKVEPPTGQKRGPGWDESLGPD